MRTRSTGAPSSSGRTRCSSSGSSSTTTTLTTLTLSYPTTNRPAPAAGAAGAAAEKAARTLRSARLAPSLTRLFRSQCDGIDPGESAQGRDGGPRVHPRYPDERREGWVGRSSDPCPASQPRSEAFGRGRSAARRLTLEGFKAPVASPADGSWAPMGRSRRPWPEQQQRLSRCLLCFCSRQARSARGG